jgi:hypothetical protein
VLLLVSGVCVGCSCLAQPGETLRSQVLESLGCWLKLSGGADLMPSLPTSPLVQVALDGLAVDGTFHAAVDAVSCRLQSISRPCTSSDVTRHTPEYVSACHGPWHVELPGAAC